MLRKALYPKLESTLNRIAETLNKKGFSPNQLTIAGLLLNFLAGWIYTTGNLFIAGVVVLLAGMGDMLDGPLARSSGRVTKFGAFLDSTVDRYSDFFLFGGLALYSVERGMNDWFLICLGIIVGSFVTSYTKARAENFIESCNVGLFERAERVLMLALGSLIPPLLPLVLWILFLGTNATAIHRILYTRKALAKT